MLPIPGLDITKHLKPVARILLGEVHMDLHRISQDLQVLVRLGLAWLSRWRMRIVDINRYAIAIQREAARHLEYHIADEE